MPLTSPDILDCLFRARWTYGDHARAATACRRWRAASRANRQPWPMLILPPGLEVFAREYVRTVGEFWFWRPTNVPLLDPASTTTPTFLRVFKRGAEQLEHPAFPAGARLCGSFPGGWLALSLHKWRGYCLVNIMSGERVHLPDLIHCPFPPLDCLLDIKVIVFSGAPDSRSQYVIGAITSGTSNIAFWRSGTARWCPPVPRATNHWRDMLPEDPVIDMVCAKGWFYALSGNEELAAFSEDVESWDDDDSGHAECNIVGDPLVMKRMNFRFRAPADRSRKMVQGRYLVVFKGKIVMIRHLHDSEAFEAFFLVEEGSVTPGTMIVRWAKCTGDFVGHAVYLGMGCSRVEESGVPGKVFVHCSDNAGGWFYP